MSAATPEKAPPSPPGRRSKRPAPVYRIVEIAPQKPSQEAADAVLAWLARVLR